MLVERAGKQIEVGMQEGLEIDAYEAIAQTYEELQPLVDDVKKIIADTSKLLEEAKIPEQTLLDTLAAPILHRDQLRAEGIVRLTLAAQYEHMAQVMQMSLELKTYLLTNGYPTRIFAYQMGTGFPFLEEGDSVVKADVLPFGQSPLSEIQKPTVPGHNEGAGIHLYIVTHENGERSTVVVIKGRAHGYSSTEDTYAHHRLALMPRVLKGIGAEFVVAGFASGGDNVKLEKTTKPDGEFLADEQVYNSDLTIGDLIVGELGFDMSSLIATQGPMAGDQTLLGMFTGGPFQNLAAQGPDAGLVKQLHQATKDLAVRGFETLEIHPGVIADASSTANFEALMDWLALRGPMEIMISMKMVPKTILDMYSNGMTGTHGMSTMPERLAYRQGIDPDEKKGIKPHLFNRRLRTMEIATVTDFVDPNGMSQIISHELVQQQAEDAKPVIARILSQLFINAA